MKTLLTIAALAATALASSGANAHTIHRHHRTGAGIVHYTYAPLPDPTSFQGLYQADGLYQSDGLYNDDCGPRVFGYCQLR